MFPLCYVHKRALGLSKFTHGNSIRFIQRLEIISKGVQLRLVAESPSLSIVTTKNHDLTGVQWQWYIALSNQKHSFRSLNKEILKGNYYRKWKTHDVFTMFHLNKLKRNTRICKFSANNKYTSKSEMATTGSQNKPQLKFVFNIYVT
jgi:hypothetical protein